MKYWATELVMASVLGAALVAIVLWELSEPSPTTVAATQAASAPAAEARYGLRAPVTITEVVDGDTVTVEVRLSARVRLIDCWAPEVRGAERQRGLAAKAFLEEMALGEPATIEVPWNGGRLDDVLTFGRLLAHVRLDGDDQTLAERMIEAGHAQRERPD